MRLCRGVGPPGPAVVAATVVLLLSGVGPARGSEDIVVGCGGFVKSDVEINYSLIEVSARPAARPSSLCDPGPLTQPLWAAVVSPLTPRGCHQPLVPRVLSPLKAPLAAGPSAFWGALERPALPAGWGPEPACAEVCGTFLVLVVHNLDQITQNQGPSKPRPPDS